MATKAKKQETLFVVLDIDDIEGMVDRRGECTPLEDAIFNQESAAIEAAEEALDVSVDFEDTDTLMIYKLVPVMKVKRAKAIVERL